MPGPRGSRHRTDCRDPLRLEPAGSAALRGLRPARGGSRPALSPVRPAARRAARRERARPAMDGADRLGGAVRRGRPRAGRRAEVPRPPGPGRARRARRRSRGTRRAVGRAATRCDRRRSGRPAAAAQARLRPRRADRRGGREAARAPARRLPRPRQRPAPGRTQPIRAAEPAAADPRRGAGAAERAPDRRCADHRRDARRRRSCASSGGMRAGRSRGLRPIDGAGFTRGVTFLAQRAREEALCESRSGVATWRSQRSSAST